MTAALAVPRIVGRPEPASRFDSSNIEAIGYDPDQRDLYVQFHGGRTYVYADVPDQTYSELLQADSKGSYLNREIKSNYAYREV